MGSDDFLNTELPIVTVIIPTYNRAYILGECLQSLAVQTASPHSFEVLVVDNNSSDNTAEVVKSFDGKVPGLRIVSAEQQGLGHARNAGLIASQTEWIASLDSDAKAHPNWIEVILREIGKGNFDCFGGPYLAWHHYGPAPPWFDQNWESSVENFNFYGAFPIGKMPTGGTCAFKKEIVMSLGGFPVDIGMKGNACSYGEETVLFLKMQQSGYILGCVPDMIIDHCVLPYKYDLRWRLKSVFANGRDWFLISTPSMTLRQFLGHFYRFLRNWLVVPWRLIWAFINRFQWQRAVLESLRPALVETGAMFSVLKKLVRYFV